MRKSTFLSALELFWVFFKIGLFTFGGGLAMISFISREVVENKKWITEKQMGDIVIIAESTPGAIAVNTATYVGYKTAGVLGSLFATLGVVLPSLIIISVIYVFFDLFKANEWFAAAFKGIRAAVIVLLFSAFLKLFKPMEKNPVTIAAAAVVFLVALLTDINPIYPIVAGGAIGVTYFLIKARRAKKALLNAQTPAETDEEGKTDSAPFERETGENPAEGGEER